MTAPLTPLAARLLMRIHLLRAARTSDASTAAAIGQALLSEDNVDLITEAAIGSAGIESSVATGPIGTLLAQLLAWITNPANLAGLISLIISLFGGNTPNPPAKMEGAA